MITSGNCPHTLLTRIGKLELRAPQDRDVRFPPDPRVFAWIFARARSRGADGENARTMNATLGQRLVAEPAGVAMIVACRCPPGRMTGIGAFFAFDQGSLSRAFRPFTGLSRG